MVAALALLLALQTPGQQPPQQGGAPGFPPPAQGQPGPGAGPLGGQLQPPQPGRPAPRPRVPVADVLKGKGPVPLYTLSQLPDGFSAVSISSGSEGGGGFMEMLMNPVMALLGGLESMGGEKPKDENPMLLMENLNLSWTTGEVIPLQIGDYLVTYKAAATDAMKGDLDARYLTLRLNLVRADQIKNMVPRPDFGKKDLVDLINKLRKMGAKKDAAKGK